MKPDAFLALIVEMRAMQASYLKTRLPSELRLAVNLERQVDRAIPKFRAELRKKTAELFSE